MNHKTLFFAIVLATSTLPAASETPLAQPQQSQTYRVMDIVEMPYVVKAIVRIQDPNGDVQYQETFRANCRMGGFQSRQSGAQPGFTITHRRYGAEGGRLWSASLSIKNFGDESIYQGPSGSSTGENVRWLFIEGRLASTTYSPRVVFEQTFDTQVCIPGVTGGMITLPMEARIHRQGGGDVVVPAEITLDIRPVEASGTALGEGQR